MKTPKLALTLVVPFVAVASVAVGWQFKNVFVDTSNVSKLATVSGNGGTEAPLGFDAYFLTEIDWGEKRDNPCSFTVEGRRRSGGAWQAAEPVSHSFGDCTKKTIESRVQVMQPTSDGSTGRFISALQVCLSEKKDSNFEKVKGIRIRTSLVDENGAVVAGNASEADASLPNCKTWENWVSCPSGQLARRILLNTNNQSAQGIGLECAPVFTGARPK